jgi:hypothetical protein
MSGAHGIIGIYRKGGSIMADTSFLENENQMVIDAELQTIAEQLLEDWMYENLNEGQFFADWRIADMSDSNYLKGRFNLFYDLKPEDEYYIEWNEEA